MRQDLYQYERYKARLGGDAPRSFHAFRKLKNEGGERWQALEDQYNLKTLAASGKIQEKLVSADTSLAESLAFMDGTMRGFIPCKASITNVKIIAAPELKTRFRSAKDRSAKFGGDPDKWVKKAGKIESVKYIFDIHWEENIDIGRINWKIKGFKER